MPSSPELIQTIISSDMLDTIGKSFRFKHAKGIAEWFKNSLDSYLRLREIGVESRNGNWPILLCLFDGKTSAQGPNLAVVDFGGTNYASVQEFLLHWGSRSAATHGGASTAAVTGGHGNGGKFYMREMWKNGARFCTWRDGKATSLIVERRNDGKTGQWEIKNQEMPWRIAFAHAFHENKGLSGADRILEQLDRELVLELDKGIRGFTVVFGRRGSQVLSSNDVVIGGRWNHQKLIDEIRDAAQARRPVRELDISVFVNGDLRIDRLTLESIDEDPDWIPLDIEVPFEIVNALASDSQGVMGTLRITKSMAPLTGRRKDMNAIFVMDSGANPLAFYPLGELPVQGSSPILNLLSGELFLNFAEVDMLVQNDRERLVWTPTTEALLHWVSLHLWDQVQKVEEEQRSQEQQSELSKATQLNNALNEHALRFLEELQTQIMVDFVDDPAGGGFGSEGDGQGPRSDRPGGTGSRRDGLGGGNGEGGTTSIPGTTRPEQRPKFPKILLSGVDEDPANPGSTKNFTVFHTPLEQDDIDKAHNVWWINTQHPFAREAMMRGGATGYAFKSHQLFMFRDVVQREALRWLQRRDAELALDRVENELSETSNRFLGELPFELIEELLGNWS